MTAVTADGETARAQAQRNQIPPELRRFAAQQSVDDIRRSRSDESLGPWYVIKTSHKFRTDRLPDGYRVGNIRPRGGYAKVNILPE